MGFLPIRELARASLRATLSGDSGLPSPRQTGPRIKSNGQSKSGFALSFASARRKRALWLFPGDPWPCGDSGRSGPAGVGARDRADSAVAQDVQSAESGRWRGPIGHDAQWAQGAGACFFGSFLCTSKERNPLAKGEWKLLL